MQPIQRQSDFYAFVDPAVAERSAAFEHDAFYEEPALYEEAQAMGLAMGLLRSPSIQRGMMDTRTAQGDMGGGPAPVSGDTGGSVAPAGGDLVQRPVEDPGIDYGTTETGIGEMAPRDIGVVS